jgi:single-stranded-DNA-specific exonuclease
MELLKKHWEIFPKITPAGSHALSQYSEIFRQVLYNRGIDNQESAYAFIKALPPKNSNPYQLLDMDKAVERIWTAIQNHEKIAVYGDYDADGVTATALLTQALRELEADVQPYIPSRFEEGYGLNKEALSKLHDNGFTLVITVDCGIRAIKEVIHANEIGLDMIITDHHQPGSELPPALAIINPKQASDRYPEKNLAGVGVAYKLACALDLERATSNSQAYFSRPDLLDLVAIGTVADIVPLTGENRNLVKEGLAIINSLNLRQGLRSLIGVSNLDPRKITAGNIGYTLAPRLNAAGRIDSASLALSLLLENDPSKCGFDAQKLNSLNSQRQELSKDIRGMAEEMILAEDSGALIFFAALDDCEPNAMGVVGLSASDLLKKYYRPSIIGYRNEEYTRASCRSIPEFNIIEALDECADLFEKHGGHAAAAGFTIHNKNLTELKNRLNEIAQRELSGQDLVPTLKADAEINLNQISEEGIKQLLAELETLQPTGHKNPTARFISRNVKINDKKLLGKEGKHLIMDIPGANCTYKAIAFQQGEWFEKIPPIVDLFYILEYNEFNGKKTIQFNVTDIKPAESY